MPVTSNRQSRRGFLRRLAGVGLSVVGVLLAGCGTPSPTAPPPTVSIPRIGYLDLGSSLAPPAELDAFRDELRELGRVERRSVAIEYRYAEGAADRLEGLAAELLGLGVDVLVVFGTQATQAAKKATTTTPIVMASSSDPVGSGLVESLARPGGNVTGLTSLAPQLTGKRLQLLKELVPGVSRVGFLWDPSSAGDQRERTEIDRAAVRLGVSLVSLAVTDPARFQEAFKPAIDERAEAIVTFASGLINRQAQEVVRFAAGRRLPAMYAQREFAAVNGGLMAYGPNYHDMYRRAAVYVDKILNGARPTDLPVEKARRFRLVINRQAAQSLGLTIPRSLLVQADEVV